MRDQPLYDSDAEFLHVQNELKAVASHLSLSTASFNRFLEPFKSEAIVEYSDGDLKLFFASGHNIQNFECKDELEKFVGSCSTVKALFSYKQFYLDGNVQEMEDWFSTLDVPLNISGTAYALPSAATEEFYSVVYD